MSLHIFESQSGRLSVRYGSEALEDPLDPVEGARAFVSPDRIASSQRVVLFGGGLGYRVHQLQALGVERPLVFEPCPDVLHLATEHGPGMPEGARVFTDLGELHQHLLHENKTGDQTLLLHAPPYQRAFPKEHAAVAQTIEEIQGLTVLRRNSVKDRAAPLVERALQNMHFASRAPGLVTLDSPLRNIPAFLVSAGPSLDRNRHLLKEASRFGAVFSVNTAAPVFAELNAPIDVLTAIEALDVSDVLATAKDVARTLALDLTSGSPNHESVAEQKVLFCADAAQYRDLAATLGIGTLAYGGSVATAVFSLAVRLGANPIVLVGQDLAYTDRRGYASGTFYESTTIRREGDILVIDRPKKWDETTRAGGLRVPSKARPCVEVDGWGGGRVESTHELVLFRRWFEMAARELKGQTRLINATEGGASIAGFQELSLEEVLDSLPVQSHTLHEAIRSARPTGLAKVRSAARNLVEGARRVNAAARRCLKQRARPSQFARAQEQLRRAAARAPLVEAHAAPALLNLRDDDSLSADELERSIFRAVAESADRVAELAAAQAKRTDNS